MDVQPEGAVRRRPERASTAMAKYPVGDFFGPVDLGLHLAGRFNSLNIGVGLLAGSILPGSNRLVVTGFSPCWGGFYVSSMGGAGLVFDNLGDQHAVARRAAPTPSVLVLNRRHGEEIDVALEPVDLPRVWASGRAGRSTGCSTTCTSAAPRATTSPPGSWPSARRRSPPTSAPSVSVPIDGNGRADARGHLGRAAAASARGCCASTTSRPSSTAAPSWTRTSATGRSPTSGSRSATRSASPRRTSRPRPSTASTRSSPPAARWA